ncbi:MAG TPA: methyltransferase domain-containing protein [Gemmataceae bacterium]|jgi:SAM-dependent methyltransferase
MQATTIQRHYDEVIASHYDFDPQSVIGDSLGKAIGQIRRRLNDTAGAAPLTVLDLGVGTGLFLERLRAKTRREIQPYGLDISQNMVSIARKRIPDLLAAVDDAANLDDHFQTLAFDLICTHFITGFVPLASLAPKILRKLENQGYWSFVGGTKSGFPRLQKKAASLPLRNWLFGGSRSNVDELVCNPADQAEVVATLIENGFTVCECETFSPDLHFDSFKDFMDFAYYGGWLTPFIEALGLHEANYLVRLLLNTFYFPAHDQHNIVIALAQKP